MRSWMWRPFDHKVSIVNDAHLIGQRFGFVHVVRRHQHRQAVLLLQVTDVLPDARPGLRIEAQRRFVQEKHFWRRHQRPGQLQPAFHASRVGPGLAVSRILQFNQGQQFGASGLALGFALAVQPPVKVQHVAACQLVIQHHLLERHADALVHLGRLLDYVKTGHLGGASRRLQQRGQHRDCGRLACPVRP